MPVGTNATVKALDPDDLARRRRVDHPRQHLPPVPAAGPRADRAARRAAPVHGLGPADPHRLGRVPGRLARRPAGRRRGRRDVPQPPRRLDSTGSRRSSRSASRRRSAPTSRSRSTSRSTRRRRGPSSPTRPSGPIAGRSARSRAHSRPGPGAVRDRPGRAGAGPARREHAVHRLAAVRRDLHRRAGRRRDAGAARRGARRRGPAAGRRSAAALPDGPRARRRTCSRRSTGEWTCSIRCSRRASPGTASCGSRAAG